MGTALSHHKTYKEKKIRPQEVGSLAHPPFLAVRPEPLSPLTNVRIFAI